MTKRLVRTVTGGWEDVADLDGVDGHNDAVDEEFDQSPPLWRASGGQTGLHLDPEGFQPSGEIGSLAALRHRCLQLPLLGSEPCGVPRQAQLLALHGRQLWDCIG